MNFRIASHPRSSSRVRVLLASAALPLASMLALSGCSSLPSGLELPEGLDAAQLQEWIETHRSDPAPDAASDDARTDSASDGPSPEAAPPPTGDGAPPAGPDAPAEASDAAAPIATPPEETIPPAPGPTTPAEASPPLVATTPAPPATQVPAAAPAYPTAIVRARTQRQSAPSLTSTLVGWYEVGARISLVCSSSGQAVKGFYSPYISGGYDSLWYRTTDGTWTADVDLDTGTNASVTSACPGAATASSREDRAIAWALSMQGSRDYPALCGKFIANAYGLGALGYATAYDFYRAQLAAGRVQTSGTPPKGAIVFTKSSYDGGAGHVAIAVGDGRYVMGGVARFDGATVWTYTSWNPAPGAQYLGWATAPSNWPGR